MRQISGCDPRGTHIKVGYGITLLRGRETRTSGAYCKIS